MGYGHLSIDEREMIMKMRAQAVSLEQIGQRLGRSKGTISRELSRNVSSTGDYKPHLAQRYYEKRRRKSKEPYRLEGDGWLRRYVRKKLSAYWSPEQISGRLHEDHDIDVSPVTIYSWIYRDAAAGGGLRIFLRQGHKTRRRRRAGEDRRVRCRTAG